MADEKREAFCEPGKPITIVSIAVKFSDFAFEPCKITEADYSDKTKLLLPAYLEDLPLSDELDLIKTLHEIIKFSSNNSENGNIAFNRHSLNYYIKLILQHDIMVAVKTRIIIILKKSILLSSLNTTKKSLFGQLHQS